MRGLPALLSILVAWGALAASSLAAQPSGADLAVQQAALYDGPDRNERLVEGARAEGELLVYTSMQGEDFAAIAQAFEKKYGIKVHSWRGSATKTLQRVVAEANGRRFEVDVIETNGPEMEALHREGLLQRVRSPHQAQLIPQALTPHGEWTATRLNVYALAYNTKLVKKDELPRGYADLLDPKWKGKLGVEATNDDWFAGVVSELGEEKGLRLFRDIAQKNGFSARIGNTLLAKLVAMGEVPLALTVYNYKAEQLKKEGADLDWFVIEPAIARANGAGVARNAPHPNAAVLFFDFMLNEAQPILLSKDFVPVSRKAETRLNQMPLRFVDPDKFLDEQEKWSGLYQQIIVEGSK